ncbi:MAG: hypothetical protein ABI557_01720 [Aureliella sp.]
MNPTPSLRKALSDSPLLFPIDMDVNGEFVQFVRTTESDYASASFLDQRMLKAGQHIAPIAWSEVSAAANHLPLYCDFIFHISHVGSTLLSRLLGQHQALFSLREPAILRRFAAGEFPERWKVFLGLWSRTFHPQQKTVIKATSFVSSIADHLLELVNDSRAVLMYVPARTFIAAMLDGVMSDIDSLAPLRLARLQNFGWLPEVQLPSLARGEKVAMSWLAEMLSLQHTAERFPERTIWLDFDAFLENVELHLAVTLSYFGVNDDCQSLLTGRTLDEYAKRPELPYNSAFRQQLLTRAKTRHVEEISLGLSWLERAFCELEHSHASTIQSLKEKSAIR